MRRQWRGFKRTQTQQFASLTSSKIPTQLSIFSFYWFLFPLLCINSKQTINPQFPSHWSLSTVLWFWFRCCGGDDGRSRIQGPDLFRRAVRQQCDRSLLRWGRDLGFLVRFGVFLFLFYFFCKLNWRNLICIVKIHVVWLFT